jgi:hypothetical protein
MEGLRMIFTPFTRSATTITPVLLKWDVLAGCSSREYLRGKYHCTVDLLFVWFGISCMTTDNFVFIFKTD